MASMSENKRLFVVISVMAVTVLFMVTVTAIMLYDKSVNRYETLLLRSIEEQQLMLQQVEARMDKTANSPQEAVEISQSFVDFVQRMLLTHTDQASITDIWLYIDEGTLRNTLLTIASSETGRHAPRIKQGTSISSPSWADAVPVNSQEPLWEADNAIFAQAFISLPIVKNGFPRELVIVKRIELRKIRLPFINTFFVIFLAAQFLIWAGSSLISSQLNPLIQYLDQQVIFNQTILNTANIPIITTDEQDEITAINQATSEVFQQESAVLLGHSIEILFHSKPTLRDYETEGKTARGKKLTLKISQGTALVNERTMHVYLAQDLTHIKETEESLRDTTEHMAVVIETVNDGVMTCNMEGIIMSANPAAEVIFGCSQQDLIGRPLSGYIDPAPEMNMPYSRLEATVVQPSRREVPVEVSYRQYHHQDQNHFSCVVRDITARRAAEQKALQMQNNLQIAVDNRTSEVKALVETAVVGVVSIDQQGRILSFNPAAEAMFGYRAEEVLHKNVALLVPTNHAVSHDNYIKRFLTTRTPRIIGKKNEVLALRKDGSQFDALLSIGHKELSDNNHLFVAHILDMTEAKRTEAELIEAKDRAEEAARVKASFLANMSHEIRTPMNAIIGFSEVLSLNDSLDTEARQQVETIRTSGQSLLTILNDILDFSKFEAGKVTLESVGFNLGNLVRDCIDVMRLKASNKGLTLKLSIHLTEPYRVVGDPNRIRQVLINLLGNAIKFTQKGSVELVVRSTKKSDRSIVVLVKDTGIGMTEAQLSNVFESFSQADSSTTRRFGGTGLGTAISKQIIEAMGGEIWVESREGEGTVFGFSLSLQPCEDSVNCLYEVSVSQAQKTSTRSFSILLAEDIRENATLVELRLSYLGHKLTWVKNGLEVLEALEAASYDLILMDIMMPQMDGLEASKRIRASKKPYAAIPIIALTASVLVEEQNRCIAAGMNAVEHKPINFSSLVDSMESVVTRSQGVPALQSTGLGSLALNHDAESGLDLSFLASVVNLPQAIEMWGDAEKYLESLNYFVSYIDNAVAEFDDSLIHVLYDEAGKQIHAIKGAVANLYIEPMYQTAIDIEEAISEQNHALCLQHCAALKSTVKRLHALLNNSGDNHEQMVIDTAILLALLQDLLDSIQLCNPDKSLPIVESLARLLPYDDIRALETSLESFDFEQTRQLAFQIAHRYQLIIEEQ